MNKDQETAAGCGACLFVGVIAALLDQAGANFWVCIIGGFVALIFFAAIANSGQKTVKSSRKAHCFNCKSPVASTTNAECLACGWLKCGCGACGCHFVR